jgi:hypothetical protein
MRENKDLTGIRDASNEAPPSRNRAVVGVVMILAVVLGVTLAFKLWKSPSLTPVPAPVATATEDKPHVAVLPSAPAAILPKPTPAALAPVSRPATASAPAIDQMTTSQLVDELGNMGLNGAITSEQAARFKQILAQLIQRGAASVPAIQGLLEKNVEIPYGSVNGGDQLGFSSLRTSLIDALSQITGPESQAAMLAILKTTAVPSELQQLAQGLNQQAPGQYQDQIASAAQETLNMASQNQLGTNTELQSAFRVVRTYGNAGTMGDPANNNPVEFSSAVQLANLPNGQGLPSLVQMAQSSTGSSQAVATEMIAQMAGQNADALNTLSQMAQNGQIQAGDWVHLASILGGNQYQMDSSGQNYTLVSGATTPDQISQRIMLIDTFTSFVPDGSGAQKALQQERSILVGKLGPN